MDNEEKPTVLVIGSPTGRYRSLLDTLHSISNVHVVYKGDEGRLMSNMPDLALLDFSKMENRILGNEHFLLTHTRGQGKSALHAQFIKNIYREPPADHPSRKREPKGPRGKWGKL